MDYEKKYNEALERAQKVKHDAETIGCSLSPDMLEVIFPELAESEDERIRKELIKLMTVAGESYVMSATGFEKERFLSYLEKQKEKKPATIEQVNGKFLSSDTLKSAKENKYIRAQLLWELMHNGIITEVDYLYLTDANRKPWTEEEYLKAYKNGFEASEQLKHLGM